MKKHVVLYCLFLFDLFQLKSFAQTNGNVQIRLDSTEMLIGGQQHLHIQCTDSLWGLKLHQVLDTLAWMNVLDEGKWERRQQYLEKKILFTVFDSGYFSIPKPIINADSLNPSVAALYLHVYFPQDSLTDLRAIKYIEETESTTRLGLIIILSLIFLVLVLFVLWQFFKADRASLISYHPANPVRPFEQAMDALDLLEKEQLWQKGEIKNYYDQLSNIVRKFLSDGLFIPAMEHTTSEVKLMIDEKLSNTNENETIIGLLTTSDLVKFANRFPGLDKHAEWMGNARAFVKSHLTLSDQLLSENKKHYLALLGEEMGNQFEIPFETVPEVLVNAYIQSKDTATLQLFTGLFRWKRFKLPASWVGLHHSNCGRFYKWQSNLFSHEGNRFLQLFLFVLSIPIIAVFLPILFLVSLWNKESLTARGIFALSRDHKIFLRKWPES